MRREHVFAVALLLTFVRAGDAVAQRMGVGLRGGASVTDFQSDLDDFGNKVGISFGVFAPVALGSWFAALPELQFINKGSDNDIDTQSQTSVASNVDVSIAYITLLVPAALTVPLGGIVEPRLYVGPTLSLEITCRVSFRVGDVVSQASCGQSIEGEPGFVKTTTFDFGVVFGGGVDVAAGPGAFTGDVRYTQGLTNINSAGEPSLRNRALEFLVGYTLALTE